MTLPEAADGHDDLDRLRFLERVFDSMEAGCCVVEVLFDAAQRAVDCLFVGSNAAFGRHTGLHQTTGRRLRELLPDVAQEWFDLLGSIALQGEPPRFELPAEVLGHCYDVQAFRVGAADEHRLALILNDITHRLVHEAAQQEADSRLRALAEDSARLLEAERIARIEADRAMRAKDEFLATLSHELRTPLSNIVSWSRLLQAQFMKDEEMLRKGLGIIHDNALAQGRLLSSLMDTTRIVSGKFELEREPLDLNALLGSVQAGVMPSAQARGVALNWQPTEAAAPLHADGARLRQVVENLLTNAIRFTPAGGTVTLTCRRAPGNQYLIEVQDTGEGIEPDMLPQIFERFRQADSLRSRGHGGLGLGLWIARQIAELHDGSISAQSAGRGRGAKFTVTLPASQDFERTAPPATERSAVASLHALKGVRILAVEDQPDMRDLLKRILEDHKARVTVVDGAAAALALLSQASAGLTFDVLISDIGLPALDGNEFIRIVRQDLQLDARRLPAVAVTAYARLEDRQRALNAGYQEHLTKPYSAMMLVSVVRRLSLARASGD